VPESQDVIAAVESGNADQLKQLLAEDRTLGRARDAGGVSALMQALYRHRKDMVELLRAAHPELDIFEAASLGRPDVVEEMVSRDPRLANARSGDGFTPLHSAAAARNLAIVRALLEHGAPVNARQQKGWTALHAAAQHGDQAMVELLLKYGANPNAKNDDGHTPDHVAHEKGHTEIAERLRAA
jgi:ankyrin repeat protein